jgi:hypothetical protein
MQKTGNEHKSRAAIQTGVDQTIADQVKVKVEEERKPMIEYEPDLPKNGVTANFIAAFVTADAANENGGCGISGW